MLIGILEILFSLCVTMPFFMKYGRYRRYYAIQKPESIATVEIIYILCIIIMIVGAFKRKTILFLPYVIVKFLFVIASTIGIAVCIGFGFLLHFQEPIWMAGFNIYNFGMIMLFIVFGLLILALNGIPILVIRSYYYEIKKREIQGNKLSATYDCVNDGFDENDDEKNDIKISKIQLGFGLIIPSLYRKKKNFRSIP